MRNRHRIPVLTAVGITATLALGACGGHDTGAPAGMDHGSVATHAGSPSATSGASTTGSAQAPGDVMFAQMMIPHHEQAVEMADLALEKAGTSSAVRDLARQIRAAQAPEIATMTGWLQQWGAPTSASGHMDHGVDGMMTDADMTTLADAEGEAFDRLWLTMMIAHHEGAVTMSRTVLSTTADPDVRALAQAVVAGQQREIATMRALTS
ncbi:DUF305 domain-containing protein [Terrabacter sp. LjRoot27]|uniref:DUF305 domain-containing protein n=1 Tax=Terrabacter sp. LjRoot27 TaxID=3342306 RepID=UPI003ED0640C